MVWGAESCKVTVGYRGLNVVPKGVGWWVLQGAQWGP